MLTALLLTAALAQAPSPVYPKYYHPPVPEGFIPTWHQTVMYDPETQLTSVGWESGVRETYKRKFDRNWPWVLGTLIPAMGGMIAGFRRIFTIQRRKTNADS